MCMCVCVYVCMCVCVCVCVRTRACVCARVWHAHVRLTSFFRFFIALKAAFFLALAAATASSLLANFGFLASSSSSDSSSCRLCLFAICVLSGVEFCWFLRFFWNSWGLTTIILLTLLRVMHGKARRRCAWDKKKGQRWNSVSGSVLPSYLV